MTNREKVIKGLECCIKLVNVGCKECPYENSCFHGGRSGRLLKDALALLKEQDALEPKKGWFLNNLNIPEEHWFCGKCDEEIVGKCKYCANCGQAVKWE